MHVDLQQFFFPASTGKKKKQKIKHFAGEQPEEKKRRKIWEMFHWVKLCLDRFLHSAVVQKRKHGRDDTDGSQCVITLALGVRDDEDSRQMVIVGSRGSRFF